MRTALHHTGARTSPSGLGWGLVTSPLGGAEGDRTTVLFEDDMSTQFPPDSDQTHHENGQPTGDGPFLTRALEMRAAEAILKWGNAILAEAAAEDDHQEAMSAPMAVAKIHQIEQWPTWRIWKARSEIVQACEDHARDLAIHAAKAMVGAR